MNSTIDIVLAYAERGLQSFPCKPHDKTPMVRWAEQATVERNMLLGWWETYPQANVAIATGKRSGVIVLDVDAGHDGYESLADLQGQYGKLPDTPTVKTGTGGEHLYFLHPGCEIRNSASKLGRGLDIRGDGGYVVAPPSIHPNGNRYEWIVKPSQVQFTPMPGWMIELLKQQESEAPALPADGIAVSGSRNDMLTRMAGSMRRKGFEEEAIFAALIIHNQKHCMPPLDREEIVNISRGMMRYVPPQDESIISPASNAHDVINKMELEIIERQKNPVDVWGIHYAWEYLSLVTGGKQKQELCIIAGEPGAGKSYFFLQDSLYTALGNPSKKIPSIPVTYWSGEMPKKQIYRRFFEMLGVEKRRMNGGGMRPEDWQIFNEAKALIVTSPIYVSDIPLELKSVSKFIEREIAEHGTEQFVFDYDWLITAPGGNEIEQSQNVSREMKQLCRKYDVHIVLISSVNKMGMGSMSENVTKSNVSGSGKKLHDADIIYILTKFNGNKNSDLSISPNDYSKMATLHIAKGRELDYHLPGGKIDYIREVPNPRFKELRDMNKPLPDWMKRKDLA